MRNMEVRSRNSMRVASAFVLIAAASSFLAASPEINASSDTLTYDLKGNIVGRVTDTGTTAFQYDNLNRLTSESGPAATQVFTYDANGNRLSDGSSTYTYVPNSNVMATDDGVSVVHDAAGNIIDDGRGLTFEYNQAGRLKRVYDGGSLVATYTYNAFGQRTRKVTPAGTVVFHYDERALLIEESLSNGDQQAAYFWREKTPVSVVFAPSTTSNTSTMEAVIYLHADHLETPTRATNETGSSVWSWNSDAHGNVDSLDDPDGDGEPTLVNLRFPGQYYDIESGSNYNWSRYYEPATGRYQTSDPIGLIAGTNTFSYVYANPLGSADSMGLQADLNLTGGSVNEKVINRSIVDSPRSYVVFAHGSEFGVSDQRGKENSRLTPQALLTLMKNDGYTQGDIVLFSCKTGMPLNGKRNFAQQLATLSKSNVRAPVHTIRVNPRILALIPRSEARFAVGGNMFQRRRQTYSDVLNDDDSFTTYKP